MWGKINISNAADGNAYLYDITDVIPMKTLPADAVRLSPARPKSIAQTASNPLDSAMTAESRNSAPGTDKNTVAQNEESVKRLLLMPR